ncbi:MAG: hypothetical protein JWO06_2418, partial [Bacteroidota bacterium]|nr:hypothetical protein [Bacteroidota bacterium]
MQPFNRNVSLYLLYYKNMKKTLLVVIGLFCFFINAALAQSLNWQWAKGSTGNEIEVTSVATDNAGNAIIGGFSTMTDSFVFAPYVLHPSGPYTQFLVKYSPSGQVLWVYRFPIPGVDAITKVTTDLNNNIYSTGASATGTFYMMKVSASGNLMWLDSSVATNLYEGCAATDITTDNAGNVYFTGSFEGTQRVFGHDTLLGAFSPFSPFNHYFLVKYTASGVEEWAKTSAPENNGYPGSAKGTALAMDRSNKLLVGGNFGGDSIAFGTVLTNGPNFGTRYSGANSFVTKYDTAGNALWARTLSGYNTTLTDLCTDQEGNVYAYGAFDDSLFIGDSLLIQRPNGSYNIFVLKFDPLGNVLWYLASTSVANATGQILTFTITTDKNDHVFISGGTFDTFSWTTDSIFYSYHPTGGLNDHAFILMLNAAG